MTFCGHSAQAALLIGLPDTVGQGLGPAEDAQSCDDIELISGFKRKCRLYSLVDAVSGGT